jgi:hypothetical protein
VLLSDWGEITTLYGMLVNSPAALSELRGGRPSLQLALFWDANVWERHVRDGRLGSLLPEQADQFGRFYPAVSGGPALVELPGVGTWPKRVSPQALAILARHGVPVRLLDRGAGTGGRPVAVPVTGCGGGGLAASVWPWASGASCCWCAARLPVVELWNRPGARRLGRLLGGAASLGDGRVDCLGAAR